MHPSSKATGSSYVSGSETPDSRGKCAIQAAVDSYSMRNHNERTPDLERVMIDLAESADAVRMVNSRNKKQSEGRSGAVVLADRMSEFCNNFI